MNVLYSDEQKCQPLGSQALLMIVKMIYCLYYDLTRDTLSNIPLCLQEFPLAWPSETPSGKGVYLTVHPLSRPNTDTV